MRTADPFDGVRDFIRKELAARPVSHWLERASRS